MTEGHGKFVWYDVMTTDVEAAAAFYKDVIGWDATDSGMGDRSYLILSMGATAVGGMMPVPAEAAARGMPPMWMGYVAVDDVDEYAVKVTAAGGSIMRGPEDIPAVGRFAVASDPQGAVFVLFKGMGSQAPDPGAPGTLGFVGWRELHAGELASAWPFYEALFGWTKAGEVDMGSAGVYQMFASGGEIPVGGMMTKVPGFPAPPAWLFYFNVDGVDAAVERATKGGAKLIHGPAEVPGGQWVANFIDPQGAFFAVVAAGR